MSGCDAGGRESVSDTSSSFCEDEIIFYTLMRDQRTRTKPAELNTAPLPALKIGLSADTIHQVSRACL